MYNSIPEYYEASFYRSTDPISNFKIKVRLEKQDVNLGTISFLDEETITNDNMVEERIFGWQEKVFSQREIDKYSTSSDRETVLEQKYEREISNLKDANSDLLKPHRLFTYVDCDDFDLEERESQSNSNKSNRKRDAVEKSASFANEGTPIVMYIMADLTTNNSKPSEEDEMLLCTLKFKNKILSIKPDFTWDNKFYTVISKAKEVYQFSLAHASKQLSREEQEKEFKIYKDMYSRRNDILQACVGCEFEMPSSNRCRVFTNAEIVSAKNFEYDHLYMSWFVDLPEGWTKSNSQPLYGVTQTCSADKEGMSYFSCPFTLDLSYSCGQDFGLNLPRIFFEVMSVDSWSRYRSEGYGYLTLPCSPGLSMNKLNCWRPKASGLLSELKRYFIGDCTELEDISYIAIPSGFRNGHLSKYSFRTISTGEITVKTFTVLQSMEHSIQSKTSELSFSASKLFGNAKSSSVSIAVDSLQRSKQRLRTVRENLVKEFISSPNVMQNIR